MRSPGIIGHCVNIVCRSLAKSPFQVPIGVMRITGFMRIEPPRDKTNKVACAPSEDRSAWASAQSDQSLRCPHEKKLGSLATH